MIPHPKRFATPTLHPCPCRSETALRWHCSFSWPSCLARGPPWPRQPRACVNGARYDIISLLGRSVTLVTFHSVDASEIDCCVPRGHGSDCGTFETSPPAKEMSVRRSNPEVA